MRARIRSVKPEFFQHGDLYDAEVAERLPLRLAFEGLWCMADREGRFEWKPRELKLNILPYDDLDFARVLDALATRGFLVRYESAGRAYGWIPAFTRHQIINNREEQSRLPAPPDDLITAHQDGTSTRAPRVDHASHTRAPRHTRGREGKGTERKGTELHHDAARRADATDHIGQPAGAEHSETLPQPPETPKANTTARTTWLTPYWDAWIAAYEGKPDAGLLSRYLKPLHDEDGVEKTLARWRNYLSSTQAAYVNVPKFATTCGSWDKPRPDGKRDPRDARPGESADQYLARQARGGP